MPWKISSISIYVSDIIPIHGLAPTQRLKPHSPTDTSSCTAAYKCALAGRSRAACPLGRDRETKACNLQKSWDRPCCKTRQYSPRSSKDQFRTFLSSSFQHRVIPRRREVAGTASYELDVVVAQLHGSRWRRSGLDGLCFPSRFEYQVARLPGRLLRRMPSRGLPRNPLPLFSRVEKADRAASTERSESLRPAAPPISLGLRSHPLCRHRGWIDARLLAALGDQAQYQCELMDLRDQCIPLISMIEEDLGVGSGTSAGVDRIFLGGIIALQRLITFG